MKPLVSTGSLVIGAALLASLCGCGSLVSHREASSQTLVAEDDAVRMEELRVRGQTQRLTVKPKQGGAPAYEFVTANRGQDTAQQRGASGQRVWSVLDF